MQPASRIIKKLGGFEAVAEMAGVGTIQVRKWTYPRDRGGADGVIPHWHWANIVEKARARGIEIAADEFLDRAAHPDDEEDSAPNDEARVA